MILHIFRKDLRRLWPIVLCLVLADFFHAAIRLELLPASDFLSGFARFLGGAVILGPMIPTLNLITITGWLLAAMVVQLDAIPGDSQDWLVRPLRRRDLLLAKLLFVVTAIHAPMLAADLAQALGSGASAGLAVTEALARNLYFFLLFTLPGLALGALTRSIGKLLLYAAGIGVGVIVFIIATLNLFPGMEPEMNATASGWTFRVVLFLAAGAAILGLQYFRRATQASRLLFAAAMVGIAISLLFLPRNTAFAMQRWLTPRQDVTLAFAPEAGRAGQGNEILGIRRMQVPLKVEGVPAGQLVMSEFLQARLVTANGARIPLSPAGNRLLAAPGKRGNIFYQTVTLAASDALERLRGAGKMRLELDYVLVVLQAESVHTLPVEGPRQRIADGLGCRTRLAAGVSGFRLEDTQSEASARVVLECRQVGQAHRGVTAALAGQNAMEILTVPSNAPFRNGSDMLADLSTSLTLTDKAQPLALTLSRPLAREVRHVVIEDFHPADWSGRAAP